MQTATRPAQIGCVPHRERNRLLEEVAVPARSDVGQAPVAQHAWRDRPAGLRRPVGAAERDPVVVEDTLCAVGRVCALQSPTGAHCLPDVAVIRPQQRVTEPVHAGVGAISRRQLRTHTHGRLPSGAKNLGTEVHDQPHAEPRGTVRVVGTRNVPLEAGERHAVLATELPSHLVHQHVTARLHRTADRDDPAIDARQLLGRISRRVDVLAQQSHVAAVLRFEIVDLRALPEPGFAGGSASTARRQNECRPSAPASKNTYLTRS